MKRTLLIGTAALALAATPAVAQVVDGEAGVTTDTDITTDVPETAMETGTDVTTEVETGVKDTTGDMAAETRMDSEVETEAGMGGDVYESEKDAAAGADMDTGAEVDIDVDTPNVETPDAEAGADVDAEADEGGQGGVYYEDEAAAGVDADLETGADVTVGVTPPEESGADVSIENETGADVDVEADTAAEGGVGGPYSANRADASARFGDLDAVADGKTAAQMAGNVSAEADTLDTAGLNAYALTQIRKAGPEAVEDADTLDKEDLSY